MIKKMIFIGMMTATLSVAGQQLRLNPKRSWSPQTHAALMWQQPTAMDVSPMGLIYVCDGGTHEIFSIDLEDDTIVRQGGYGSDAGSFQHPMAVDASNGLNIYIADRDNHRIQRLDRQLNALEIIEAGESWDEDFVFQWPRDVCLNPLGDLFILDGDRARVLRFSPLNEAQLIFGHLETAGPALENPIRMITLPQGRLLISDESLGMLHLYTDTGDFLASLGASVLEAPSAMALGEKNRFWVWDLGRGALVLMSFSGELLARWDSLSFGDAAVNDVADLAVHRGYLYLLSHSPPRLYEFEISR